MPDLIDLLDPMMAQQLRLSSVRWWGSAGRNITPCSVLRRGAWGQNQSKLCEVICLSLSLFHTLHTLHHLTVITFSLVDGSNSLNQLKVKKKKQKVEQYIREFTEIRGLSTYFTYCSKEEGSLHMPRVPCILEPGAQNERLSPTSQMIFIWALSVCRIGATVIGKESGNRRTFRHQPRAGSGEVRGGRFRRRRGWGGGGPH